MSHENPRLIKVTLPEADRSFAIEVGEDGFVSNLAAVENGAVGSDIDLHGSAVYPGFIDIHIHGAVGVDVNSADADGLMEVAGFLARHGVTAWMPTLVPDSDENYRRVIAAIDRLMEIQGEMPIAQAVGVHYEGVFANEKMCGALRPEFFKTFARNHADTIPSAEAASNRSKAGGEREEREPPRPPKAAATPPSKGGELIGLPRLKRGVHMTTLAPEIDGGIELTRELVRQGWVVSVGHTKADVETLDQAFAAGARHLTHFFNAMTGLHHRDVGVVGWALTKDEVTFDIIADGVHVHPKMLEYACRSKSPGKVSLISDSIAPTGLGDGEYNVWGEKISVVNGRTENERGSIAGSVITMLDAVNRMLSLGFSPTEVSKMASLNPAKLLGIDKNYGSIEVGKRADLVAMNADGIVKLVMIGGQIVYEA
ncbi:MAG: N-acetylglucosamine-6-phosphate deacetylase [Pyrinomonadaceae bacterium]